MRFWIFQTGHDHQPAAAPAPRAVSTVYMIGYDCWGVAPCPEMLASPVVGLESGGCPDEATLASPPDSRSPPPV